VKSLVNNGPEIDIGAAGLIVNGDGGLLGATEGSLTSQEVFIT
jgi:hypothetical protein